MKTLLAMFFLLFSTHANAQTCSSVPTGMDCVSNGATKDISAFSTCARITNSHSSGKAVMVPIKTSAEWSAFRTKNPAGVTVGSCSTRVYLVYGTPGSSSLARPVDWQDSGSLVECVGGGGGGSSTSSKGGEGGSYTAISNFVFSMGYSLTIEVGAGGAAAINGGTSSITDQTMVQVLAADGGFSGSSAGFHLLPDLPAYGYPGGTSIGSTGLGDSGGGGAAGPNGDGMDGGGTSSGGGGGGGGANGGQVGSNGVASIGGNGGSGPLGLGGAGGSGGNGSAAVGGAGGGGGGGASGFDGGKGSTALTLGGGAVGIGGGGGGAGSSGAFGGAGGRGGGGGGARVGTGGAGGNGFCVISYVP